VTPIAVGKQNSRSIAFGPMKSIVGAIPREETVNAAGQGKRCRTKGKCSATQRNGEGEKPGFTYKKDPEKSGSRPCG